MIKNLIPFVWNPICYQKFSLPLKLKKLWVDCHSVNLFFYWDFLFSTFTSYWWNIYLKTSFPAISETQIWRLRARFMATATNIRSTAQTNFLFIVFLLNWKQIQSESLVCWNFSITIISLTLGFKKKMLNILWPSQSKEFSSWVIADELTNTINCVLSRIKKKSQLNQNNDYTAHNEINMISLNKHIHQRLLKTYLAIQSFSRDKGRQYSFYNTVVVCSCHQKVPQFIKT